MNLTSKIALGSVQFGISYGISNKEGKTTFEEAKSILDYSFNSGINTIDTAIAYGNAESVIGDLNQNRFEIITKFLPENQNGPLEKQLDLSLRNLKQNSVYGLLAHRPLDVIENPEIWEKLLLLKKSGKVKKIGLSLNTIEEFEKISTRKIYPDLVQVPYNYFDNRFEYIMSELKGKNCEIHVRSVFLQGLFYSKTDELSDFFNQVKPLIDNLQKVYGQSLASALINYVLSNKNIDKIVLGIQNKEQIQQIVESLNDAPKLPKNDFEIDKCILQPSLWPN